MTKQKIKDLLIKAGVNNVKEYGYPSVSEKNILTDDVYKEFFKSMLSDNKGQSSDIDDVIDELMGAIGNPKRD